MNYCHHHHHQLRNVTLLLTIENDKNKYNVMLVFNVNHQHAKVTRIVEKSTEILAV